MSEKYRQDWRSYKPNKSGTGAASKLELRVVTKKVGNYDRRDVLVFWVSTKQIAGTDDSGNSQFAWKNEEDTVTLKLGEVDIGDMLSVLNRKKNSVGGKNGIYHQNERGNSSFNFNWIPGDAEKGTQPCYGVKVSKQIDGKVTRVQHLLTLGEGEVLKILLERATQIIYDW